MSRLPCYRAFRIYLPALLLLLALPSLSAEAVKDLPKPTNYVSDFAGVLSPQTTADLNRLCYQVDTQAHAQIAVVIIKTLDDVPIEDFATSLEEKWGVGQKKTDKGILLLLATQDRKRRIEVGYGLEGVITDATAGIIGRSMVPDLQQGNYDGAVSLAINQIAGKIAADAGVTLQATPRGSPRRGQGRPISLGQLLTMGLIFLLLIFFLARSGGSGILGFILGMLMGGGGRGGGGWGGGGGDGSGGGFDGFGGGSSGGGGASGDW